MAKQGDHFLREDERLLTGGSFISIALQMWGQLILNLQRGCSLTIRAFFFIRLSPLRDPLITYSKCTSLYGPSRSQGNGKATTILSRLPQNSSKVIFSYFLAQKWQMSLAWIQLSRPGIRVVSSSRLRKPLQLTPPLNSKNSYMVLRQGRTCESISPHVTCSDSVSIMRQRGTEWLGSLSPQLATSTYSLSGSTLTRSATRLISPTKLSKLSRPALLIIDSRALPDRVGHSSRSMRLARLGSMQKLVSTVFLVQSWVNLLRRESWYYPSFDLVGDSTALCCLRLGLRGEEGVGGLLGWESLWSWAGVRKKCWTLLILPMALQPWESCSCSSSWQILWGAGTSLLLLRWLAQMSQSARHMTSNLWWQELLRVCPEKTCLKGVVACLFLSCRKSRQLTGLLMTLGTIPSSLPILKYPLSSSSS